MPFELHDQGADIAIAVSGPDLATCCSAAVEGFAASFAETSATPHPVGLEVQGSEPDELLAEVLETVIARLDTDGEVALGLDDVRVEGGSLRGVLQVVGVDQVGLTGAVPKAVTWHDLRLEETSEGWRGQVVLDL